MSEEETPGWAWIFVAACAAIPLVALGGMIPAGIGAIGATTCSGIAREGSGDTKQRISICAAITILCWALFGGLVWAVLNQQSQQPKSSKSYSSSIEQKTELTRSDKKAIYLKAASRRETIRERKERLEQALLMMVGEPRF